MVITFMLSLILASFCLNGDSLAASENNTAGKPNILVILTDDVGWGDYKCYNEKGKIPSPNVDRLAREGMRFTNAHTPAALCSPTRYSMLTGNFPWRGRDPAGTWGFNVPCQVLPGQKTVANLLKEAGYRTAMFGKQGFGGQHAKKTDGAPDFTKPMIDGPRSWGFDYSAIIPRGHQAAPYMFLVDELPECGADQLVRAQAKNPAGKAKGGKINAGTDYSEPGWDHSVVGRRLLGHAEKFLDWHLSQNRDSGTNASFFMHFCSDGAHSPYVPAETLAGQKLKGETKMTEHTDMVMETDILLGALMAMLEKRGLLESTLICLTSDNGGLPYERDCGHDAVGGLRGRKGFIFEGGHRVPFLVRWPGKIAPGTVRSQFICTHDIVATALELADVKIPDNQCLDSVSFLPVLLGKRDDTQPVRRSLLVQSSPNRDADNDGGFSGAGVVINAAEGVKASHKADAKPRQAKNNASDHMAHALYGGDWKLVIDMADQPAALYDLKNDLAERNNVIGDVGQRERVKSMERTYREIRASKASAAICKGCP